MKVDRTAPPPSSHSVSRRSGGESNSEGAVSKDTAFSGSDTSLTSCKGVEGGAQISEGCFRNTGFFEADQLTDIGQHWQALKSLPECNPTAMAKAVQLITEMSSSGVNTVTLANTLVLQGVVPLDDRGQSEVKSD